MTPVYFLSLLGVVYGGFIIDIDVRTDPPYIDIRNSISTTVISDVERETFKIQDARLKAAVAAYTTDNIVPDFVYVKKTGEENDLYAKISDSREIKRIVKPKNVDIQDPDIKIDCKPKTNMTTEIRTDWKINGTLTIADNITHIVYFDGEQKMEVSAWGQGVSKQYQIPGDHVQFCTMNITIEYEITIAGDVAADYTKPRKSTDDNSVHHYYAYDVFNVQKAAGLPKSVIGSETITVIYPKKKETPVSSKTTKSTS